MFDKRILISNSPDLHTHNAVKITSEVWRGTILSCIFVSTNYFSVECSSEQCLCRKFFIAIRLQLVCLYLRRVIVGSLIIKQLSVHANFGEKHQPCFWPRAPRGPIPIFGQDFPFHVLSEIRVNSHHLLTKWMSGSHQAVVRQSSGSRQAVVRQSLKTFSVLWNSRIRRKIVL